jgi:glycosyltransferase involved in cell wall biosynthesis
VNAVLLTRSLAAGGAERQLCLLARGLARRGHRVRVVAMYPGGTLAGELKRAGVAVVQMHKRGRWDAGFAARLARRLRRLEPAVVVSYLDAPNLIAAALRSLLPGVRLVWQVRTAYMDLARFGAFARVVNRLTYPASRLAHGVVFNSRAGRDLHLAKGMRPRRLAVIPNGVDTAAFAYDPQGRSRLRRAWGVEPDQLLVGLPARLDPMKDHPVFLIAAARVAAEIPGARFVCLGGGPEGYRRELASRAQALGLGRRLLWAGERQDMAAALSALDLAVQSSYGEGFPNAPAEAMACGRPVAATAVGDTAWLVGEPALLAPPRDPAALAARMLAVLSLPKDRRRALGERLRRRVARRFSGSAMVTASEEFLRRVAGEGT